MSVRSNGIAERFVRTRKAWLAERAWDRVEGLEPLLAQFAAAYNDRPATPAAALAAINSRRVIGV